MHSTLSEALAARGFDTLTDVQQAVTDPQLSDADLLVSARTGSGKTVGFGLAIARTLLGHEPRFDAAGAPLALVVAPTRELALQVSAELAWLYEMTGARISTCIGGMDARTERRGLERGAHIVVGPPGRLRDHITRGALDLGAVRAVVLDEADEMLDLGFREDLEFMLEATPADKRTLLFSATVPPTIAELAKSFQRDAVRISTVTKGEQHADITYQAVQVAHGDDEHAIINMLRYHDAPTAIVFANTRAAVTRLTARLANRGFSVVSLSGELSQDERSHALQALRDGRARVCVATDVAARGIDLPQLSLVIHADLPTNTEALLHRSGRTGRAGRKGISALIVSDKIAKKAGRLLKWARIEAEWVSAPGPDEIRTSDFARLMADPVWATEPDEDLKPLLSQLVEAHGAEALAAACLQFYLGGLSAPEELNTSAPAARSLRDPAAFGPAIWLELSVGRDDGAEPRWLLPTLCKAAGVDKTVIGRIRVQQSRSVIELSQTVQDKVAAALAADGMLNGEIAARILDEVPDLSGPSGDGPRRPMRKEGGPRKDAPRKSGPGGPKPFAKPGAKPGGKPFGKPGGPRPARDWQEGGKPATPPRVAAPAPQAEAAAKPKPSP